MVLQPPLAFFLIGRFNSLNGRFVSLLGGFISLFDRLGNSFPRALEFNYLEGGFRSPQAA
jgi:hypothetical protein